MFLTHSFELLTANVDASKKGKTTTLPIPIRMTFVVHPSYYYYVITDESRLEDFGLSRGLAVFGKEKTLGHLRKSQFRTIHFHVSKYRMYLARR